MTISLDEAVYDGLYRTIGKRRMSLLIENLVRPHVIDTALDAGYQAMASDYEREKDASEWINTLALVRRVRVGVAPLFEIYARSL
jgi:hypothetical protein